MLREIPASDRPEDEVVNDDALCDKWFDQYTRQLALEASEFARVQQKHRRPVPGSKAGFDIPQFGG